MCAPVTDVVTPMKAIAAQLSKSLLAWYKENHRDLPWRKNRDPYRIWISEVMLQQTTVAAVIPYYEKFLARFPTVESLGSAPLEDVLEMWAGLGYYSRARNLHKSAQALLAIGFPKTTEKLLDLPGFGPYTARAVASLAFDEPVGVLDGNVIRVLTRVYGWDIDWWSTKARAQLQLAADEIARGGPSHLLNQGLMELGATICTPQNPTCLLCPWQKHCVAYHTDQIAKLPRKKPRKESEVWVWTAQVLRKGDKVALIANDYAPFLKGQLIFPGSIKQQNQKPKTFDLKHGITHHDIYIRIEKSTEKPIKSNSKELQWIAVKDIKKVSPSNLLQKVLQRV
jgi:A/G-specific adenine glycosylase